MEKSIGSIARAPTQPFRLGGGPQLATTSRLPLFLLFVVSIAGIIATLILAAKWQDDAYRRGLGESLRAAMAIHEDNLRKTLQDYAHWDATVESGVMARDAVWADENIGLYVQGAFPVSTTLLLSSTDEPLYAAADGKRLEPAALAAMTDVVSPLVAAARANPMDSPKPHSAYFSFGDRIQFVAAAPVTPQIPTEAEMERHPRPVLLYARTVDDIWLSDIAALLPFVTVAIERPASAVADFLALPLKGPDGTPVARVVANTVTPGARLVGWIVPVIAGVFFVMAILVWVMVSQERRIRKENEQRLTAAALEAERANRGKSVFLAQMSHELRTPLNAVIGFGEMIQQQVYGPLGDARYAESAEQILIGGRHLLSLINDILDLARLESGSWTPMETEIDPAEAIEQCFAMLAPMARNAGTACRLDLSADPPLPELRADERAFRQMLINLISNAIKHSRPGSEILIQVSPTAEGELSVACIDSGVGISAADLLRIRKPFERVEEGPSARTGGIGLGLAIVDALIRFHGGRLEIESTVGVGTRAALHFPADRVSQI